MPVGRKSIHSRPQQYGSISGIDASASRLHKGERRILGDDERKRMNVAIKRNGYKQESERETTETRQTLWMQRKEHANKLTR